jgi:hypothetical protein
LPRPQDLPLKTRRARLRSQRPEPEPARPTLRGRLRVLGYPELWVCATFWVEFRLSKLKYQSNIVSSELVQMRCRIPLPHPAQRRHHEVA